jgi:hypothetical protein
MELCVTITTLFIIAIIGVASEIKNIIDTLFGKKGKGNE